MKNEVDAKNFQVNAEPFPTGVVWAQIVKATQVMTMMKTSLINGAINPLYRIMQVYRPQPQHKEGNVSIPYIG